MSKSFASKITMANKIYGLLIFIFTASVVFAQNAGLKGQIIDKKTKEPLSGAYVHFDDKKGGAITDAFGQYFISNVLPGFYKVK